MSEKHDHDSHYRELSGHEGQAKIAELVHGIRIAMMTTVAKDGTMSSRPMAVQDTPFNGTLWFLTRVQSEKVDELGKDHHVTLTFAEPKDSKYITLKGMGNVSQDRGKIKELWNPMYKAWFPKGQDDPEIAVLRVEVSDPGAGFSGSVPEPTAGQPGGWGLFLTEQLADRWGIDRDAGWTTVWLERDLGAALQPAEPA